MAVGRRKCATRSMEGDSPESVEAVSVSTDGIGFGRNTSPRSSKSLWTSVRRDIRLRVS